MGVERRPTVGRRTPGRARCVATHTLGIREPKTRAMDSEEPILAFLETLCALSCRRVTAAHTVIDLETRAEHVVADFAAVVTGDGHEVVARFRCDE